MKKITRAVAMACLGMAGLAHADGATQFSFGGFGTLGATYSNNHEADFRHTLVMPGGPGASKATDPGIDTKLGLQGSANFGNGLSGIVQVVVDRRYDNAYSPEFEWANLKYDVSKNLYVRAGRVVAPVFMYSEQRNVGYSLTAVRADAEVYSLNPITHLDGADIGGKLDIAGGVWSLQATGGRTQLKLGVGVEIKGPAAMFNTTYEKGDSTFRMGYSQYKLDLRGLDALTAGAFAGYQQVMNAINNGLPLGYPTVTANVKFSDIRARVWGLGYAYDDGQWLVQSEYVRRRSGGYVVQDGDAWSVLAGYRSGKFTPYVSYSKLASKEPRGQAPAVGLGDPMTNFLASVVNDVDANYVRHNEQDRLSLGVRYDLYKNTVLKLQMDHVRKPADSGTGNIGLFQTYPASYPNFVTDKRSVNLVSLNLDFVF